ncbi:MAG TPA: fatty acid desaturase [Steroidobacteraceae bacterium]|nr:fatty acid desaturase [Steroidobacteraceae bacterium]
MNAATRDGRAGGATALRGERVAAIEWPTVALLFATYGGWLAVTAQYRRWPFAIVAPATALLLTLHSSLQHEILHGHPTRKPWLNRVLAMWPLSLWLPYPRYRDAHLAHHCDERLTDPLDDPESCYLTPDAWARLHPIARASLEVQQTLAGRVLVGSFWRIGAFLHAELRGVMRGDDGLRRLWLEHLAWCVPVLLWLKLVCGMPLWLYAVSMVIPAYGIVLIRSFAEHRARPNVRERVAIVEGSWLLGPLFLFNNLHALHHEAPTIPWYRYNARYRRHRRRLIAANGGLVYRTYFDVARRFLLRPHDAIAHPTGRVPVAGP